jgi:Na+/H+ antiporter NhaD/arsenite permease-like protein
MLPTCQCSHNVSDLLVLFPQPITVPIPRPVWKGTLNALAFCRVIDPLGRESSTGSANPSNIKGARTSHASSPAGQALSHDLHRDSNKRFQVASKEYLTRIRPWFVPFTFQLDFVTAPLIADLFLLCILAIGRREVHDGTVGTDNIFPIDIMAFFITLAYIAISLDASGLIRWLAFKVQQKGGGHGRRLYLYLYIFFFLLSTAVGNDPVILSGTAFLAYMIRVSENIDEPGTACECGQQSYIILFLTQRVGIYTQFAIANIGSAILVSSNPTNLVLAGAFKIKFVTYTANMIVPVVVTAIMLFPFLLYIVFSGDEQAHIPGQRPNKLIPSKIKLRDLPEHMKGLDKINPNIPNAEHARVYAQGGSDMPGDRNPVRGSDTADSKDIMLEAIMNPFLDRWSAIFGASVMAVTLVAILVLNAVTDTSHEHPVFWVTLPAAFLMFSWDAFRDWQRRSITREIARRGRNRARQGKDNEEASSPEVVNDASAREKSHDASTLPSTSTKETSMVKRAVDEAVEPLDAKRVHADMKESAEGEADKCTPSLGHPPSQPTKHTTLVSLLKDWYQWLQETFPTVTAVASHLPFALIPFALTMFVLVQALSTKGWIAVFAYGWDHWVNKTGTVGAVGGMAFLSVIMCNVSKIKGRQSCHCSD